MYSPTPLSVCVAVPPADWNHSPIRVYHHRHSYYLVQDDVELFPEGLSEEDLAQVIGGPGWRFRRINLMPRFIGVMRRLGFSM